MPLLNVNILTGPPGSGKSVELLTQAAKSPARYLLAVPLINLIEEHAATLKRLNPGLVVIPAHSQAKAKRTVAAHLTRIAAEITSKHVVVAITHESLLGLDLQAFADWRLLIDETPNAVVSGASRWAAVGHLLPTACGLSPVGQRGWSCLTLKPEALTSRASDCSITKIDPALGRALRRPQGVLVKATTWKAIERLSEFSWLSVWSLNAARPCESVTLASASFSDSLMARTIASAAPDDLHLTITTLAPQRAAQPTIRLRYFAQGHEGSTAFWDSSEGRRCLKAVADHLEHHVPSLGFWSANDGVWELLEHRAHGLRLCARTIGTNEHRALTSCAMIYSAKATPQDRALQDLTGLSSGAIRTAREDEDIYQFVCRGAIRDLEFGGVYNVHLYSRTQAERLATRLRSGGYTDVSLTGVPEAGIMEIGREAKTPIRSAEERAARKRALSSERQRRRRARLAARSSAGHHAELRRHR